MIIKYYIVLTLLSITDEVWNINNPRPYPKKNYNYLQWEKADFYSQKINNQWVLRHSRKTDSYIKKQVRKKYWAKRLKIKK
tara:strand:- start:154 stop:396 length:243 start_codon:yes stop_codon:yes gene_type:complete